ncbi:ataxin-10 [Adelges cooleyi]|uniref:ataxin-10 n=1 Tax=Adelges cooleyi TaxID=133065 RepID=UPI0021807A16|nr:ataxin-10 [Adelges cooleyi]
MEDQVHDQFTCFVSKLMEVRKSKKCIEKTDTDGNNGITDIFRWLRNNSPRLNNNSKQLLLDSGLVEICLWYFDVHFHDDLLSLSILLQFLANFSINYKPAQQMIFKDFHSTLRNHLLSSYDTKLLNNTIMLLYNLSLPNNDLRSIILGDVEIIKKILNCWQQKELEYCKIFLDSLFFNHDEFLSVYNNLSCSDKKNLLDVLSYWLEHYNDDVPLELVNTIKDELFLECAIDQITSPVVKVLAKASSMDKFKSSIQTHTAFLKKLIEVLKYIHESSKSSSGNKDEFSQAKNLSALFTNSEITNHSRFWFKSDVIQLIANICYNHEEHQNLMRTHNIIPILLECCSFDAKNPLMREWSLFALRNILDGNLDNQTFLANIDSVGSIDPESVVTL